MGKAKSGKSNVLKIVSIVAAILVAVGIIAVFVAPLIPVRKVDESAYKKLDNNDVYERAYNIYGVQIYKDRDKALAQFKADYNDALVYLNEKLVLGEFNTSYDMLSQYGENGWQYTFSADEKRELGEEKVNELKQKMLHRAARVDLTGLFIFHHAHTARAINGKVGVIAECRHFNTGLANDGKHILFAVEVDALTVNDHHTFCHVSQPSSSMASIAPNGQAPQHAPQWIHLSLSMVCGIRISPEMASIGQLRLHLPQPLHSSGLMTRRRLRPLQIGQ